MRKPNPEIYEYVLKKAKVKPNEAVFIDDKQLALEPAIKMGIESILFETPEKLREKLLKLSIL